MTKEIRITDIPEDVYWEWKQHKTEVKASNWREYFTEYTDVSTSDSVGTNEI